MSDSVTLKTLGLIEPLHTFMQNSGYHTLTPIQALAVPPAVSGRDVIAKAKTGSGKTLAFTLPILNTLNPQARLPQALILCPTRELAEQVAEQMRAAAQYIANVKVLTLCGGVPVPPQIASLKHGANIIVGTPGRVMDHLMKRRLILDEVNHFVLDEADRMLDMGFEDELNAIGKALPVSHQSLLFSATFPDSVNQLMASMTQDALRVEAPDNSVQSNITQLVYRVEEHTRLQTLQAVLTDEQPTTAIVFCGTKKDTQAVTDELNASGFSAVGLHGDLEQRDRTAMLAMFASGSARVLVATDVAARGLDIEAVELVINFKVSEDADTHIHRIGRTGRAGLSGKAISLASSAEDIFVARIEEHMDCSLPRKGGQSLRFHANRIIAPEYTTIQLSAGKKDKLRPGDILGSLTKDASILNDDIGKIKVTATVSFVAVKLRSVKRAMAFFRDGKVKGKRVRARKLTPIVS
ncbi:ATP-dependent RNA helicase DbpA [Alteromonas facilis]|uniref:ATP-dependent RNA helicase DbpA n=1 Tax=Alteromonas facilis TaxID=2048004 RepID=UPI000C284D5B|nr:ATP-dependent RNA helicase DbpA [Alteromonas facilis]